MPGGARTQLLDADAAWDVHPLLVRQEFVVEADEAVQSGQHVGTSTVCAGDMDAGLQSSSGQRGSTGPAG